MDVIDELAGIAPGSPLDGMRENRKQARIHSQATFDALFTPLDDSEMPVAERAAVAAFVTGLHGEPTTAAFYLARVDVALRPVVAAEIDAAAGQGPYGAFPAGRLSAEDVPGPTHRVAVAKTALGPRLTAALEHAHMLVFHPRDAAPAAAQALLDAGWSTTGIVTLSQLVAFLSFQVRVVAGLRVLAAHPPAPHVAEATP